MASLMTSNSLVLVESAYGGTAFFTFKTEREVIEFLARRRGSGFAACHLLRTMASELEEAAGTERKAESQ